MKDTNLTYIEEEKGELVEGPPRVLQVLGITSVNCEEWVTTDLAANLLGITTVPLYETLGATMMQLILEQTQMSTIFGSDKCLMNIISLAAQGDSIANSQGQRPGELRYLQNLVVFGTPSVALVEVCKQYGIMLWEYGALIEEEVRSQGDSF